MKKSLEIVLRSVYCGAARRVVTLAINGVDAVTPFLDALQKSQHAEFNQLRTCMRVIAEHRHYQNERKFKNLGGGLYEIKTRLGLRVYAFLDDLPVCEQQLVIAACGGGKNTSKEQNRDIERAREIHARYLNAKQNERTHVVFIPLKDEN